MSLARPSANSTPPSLGRHVGGWFDSQVATLYPGCFGLVMATGIISNAFFVEGWRGWSDALFVVNLVSYPCLVLLTSLRLVRFPRALWADLINPRLVFSFFTLVAGTSVFGAGIHLRGFATVALSLWLFALLVWLVLIYFGFGVMVVVNNSTQDGLIHGAWLMAIVGTEALVILGTLIAPATGDAGPTVFVFIHLLWGVGLGLYGIFIVLFCYRIFFFERSSSRCDARAVGRHGRRRDQYQCRLDAHSRRHRHSVPACDAAIHRRHHAHRLGMGDLVDSVVVAVRNLETRRLSHTPDLHAIVLESRISPRHVWPGQYASFARHRLSAVARDFGSHGVDCACGVGRHSGRTRHRVLAQLLRVRAVEATVVFPELFRQVPMTRLVRPFVAGLLVVLPAVLTLVLLGWIGNLIYGFVGPGSLVGRGLVAIGLGFVSSQIVAYLIGIAVALAAIYLLGLVVETRVRQRVGGLLDRLLRRVPLVGNVYDLSKRFVAIVDRKDGDSLQSMRPVWCFFGGEGGAAVLALCPLPDPIMIGAEPYTAVLVPSAPVPVGGCLIYVPTKWTKPADIGVEVLTSVYVSMGMTPATGAAIACRRGG